MTPQKQLTAAERYAEAIKKRPSAIVKLTLPESGFVIEMRKPSMLRLAFSATLPKHLTNKAATAWSEDGDDADIAAAQSDAETDEATANFIKIRDGIIDYSVNPKLVIGEAKNDNELSAELLSEEDLIFLVSWFSSGGDEGIALENFRQRQAGNALPRTNGKKRRTKTK